jgi:hypothetical protein
VDDNWCELFSCLEKPLEEGSNPSEGLYAEGVYDQLIYFNIENDRTILYTNRMP